MACGVTLKRSLELDSLMSPESSLKRRRTSMNAGHCAPFRPPFSNSPPHHHQQQQQPQHNADTGSSTANAVPSPFSTAGPKISPEELETYLMSEIQSRRRRRLHPNRQPGGYFGGGQASPSSGSSDSESEHHMDSAPTAGMHPSGFGFARTQSRAANSASHAERPTFTYKQVRVICERLLKEQEIRLREEYDQVLNARLAEQYETFVRFTYDQIHRRIDDSPMTYLS